mmetsp:Transcript_17792/g.60052  ORF Transcript_17792/g.60052 Transcript_17792/m.60052 type:complete len:330 (-) Transcript_17792:1300-2289(-)
MRRLPALLLPLQRRVAGDPLPVQGPAGRAAAHAQVLRQPRQAGVWRRARVHGHSRHVQRRGRARGFGEELEGARQRRGLAHGGGAAHEAVFERGDEGRPRGLRRARAFGVGLGPPGTDRGHRRPNDVGARHRGRLQRGGRDARHAHLVRRQRGLAPSAHREDPRAAPVFAAPQNRRLGHDGRPRARHRRGAVPEAHLHERRLLVDAAAQVLLGNAARGRRLPHPPLRRRDRLRLRVHGLHLSTRHHAADGQVLAHADWELRLEARRRARGPRGHRQDRVEQGPGKGHGHPVRRLQLLRPDRLQDDGQALPRPGAVRVLDVPRRVQPHRH